MVERPLVSLVLPVFNESEGIESFHLALSRVLSGLHDYRFELLYVDDGSADDTGGKLLTIAASDPRVGVIRLSRNFGHQAALSCGLDHCRGDAAVCMDTDLQHPPELLPELIAKWEQGFDVVYTIRKETRSQSFLKHMTGRLFYGLMSRLSEVPIHENAADFRLISRKVLDVFQQDLRERTRFLRGLVSWVGFRSIAVPFVASERAMGVTKYSLRKMLRLAEEGLTSFSTAPLKAGLMLGGLFGIVSIGYGMHALYSALFTDRVVPGWASLFILLCFLSAIHFTLIGLLGTYLGHVFQEIKRRPVYIVEAVEGAALTSMLRAPTQRLKEMST